MSPVASYQYDEGLTVAMSPVGSYQYCEWPGNDVLGQQSSPQASYFYQFLFPTVTTPTAAGITYTMATLGGNITYTGDTTLTAAGVVYAPLAVNANPQLGGPGVVSATSTATGGVFAVNVGALSPNTDYVYAAYATNSTGTAYSATGIFTTNPMRNWFASYGFAAFSDVGTAPNGDGVSLLMDYALNLDPTKNQAANMPKAVVSAGQLSYTFYAGNTDVGYQVQASADLKTWSAAGVTVSAPDGNCNCTATVPLASGLRFLRLVVTH